MPLGHELIAVVHDEGTANVELDVAALLLGLEQIRWSTSGHKQQSPELKLTLDAEVLGGEVNHES